MHKQKQIFEIGLVVLSIAIAVWMVQSPVFGNLLNSLGDFGIFGAILIGIFYTSLLTSGPAIVALALLSKTLSMPEIVIGGAIGAAFGDYLIYKVLGVRIGSSINDFLSHHMNKYQENIQKYGAVATVTGAAIIASPLPDEIGVSLMGMHNTKPVWTSLILLGINIVGIFAFVSILK